jgi:hypothetical protein
MMPEEPKKKDNGTPKDAAQSEISAEERRELENLRAFRSTLSKNAVTMKLIKGIQEGKEMDVVEVEPGKKKDLHANLKGEGDDDSKSIKDIDDMSQSEVVNLILNRVADAVETYAGDLTKGIDEQLQGINSNLVQTQGVFLHHMRDEKVDSLRKNLPDYGRFEKEIDEYVSKHPIPLEDAYRIVKSRHVGDEVPEDEVDSERPTTPGSDWSPNRKKEKPAGGDDTSHPRDVVASSRRGGKASFRQILISGANKAIK